MNKESTRACPVERQNCNTETDKVKEFLEYLPGEFAAYKRLTCEQYLEFMAGFYGDRKTKQRGRELADYFDLDLSRRIGDCSQGMKRKLGLIQVFMVDCPLYILDEPTSGLDPLIQQKFYKLISEKQKENKTIFLSSHILSEVERICERVAIIRNGELVEVNTVDNIKNKKFKNVKVVYKDDIDEKFFNKKGIELIKVGERETVLRITSNLGANLHYLTSKKIKDIKVMDPSLEEVFLSYYRI